MSSHIKFTQPFNGHKLAYEPEEYPSEMQITSLLLLEIRIASAGCLLGKKLGLKAWQFAATDSFLQVAKCSTATVVHA